VNLSAVRTNEAVTKKDCYKRWGRSMRTDEQQCLSMMTVDSRSDVDDLRTRDCLYGESRQVRYDGFCSLTAL